MQCRLEVAAELQQRWRRTNRRRKSIPLGPYEVWGSAVSSPVGSGVKPQPTNDSVHIGVKSAALVAAVFVDFPKNRRNFLHENSETKNKNCGWVRFLTGRRRPMTRSSPGAVATIALCKSAPTCLIIILTWWHSQNVVL